MRPDGRACEGIRDYVVHVMVRSCVLSCRLFFSPRSVEVLSVAEVIFGPRLVGVTSEILSLVGKVSSQRPWSKELKTCVRGGMGLGVKMW